MTRSLGEAATDDVQQFARNRLLAPLVVFEGELFEQFVGIVAGQLHRHGAGGVFGGATVHQHSVDLEQQDLRQKGFEHFFLAGLDDEVFFVPEGRAFRQGQREIGLADRRLGGVGLVVIV